MMDLFFKYRLTQRVVLGLAVYMTWESTKWSMIFAAESQKNGTEIAAIIAAVTAPIMAFTAIVFKTYAENRDQ